MMAGFVVRGASVNSVLYRLLGDSASCRCVVGLERDIACAYTIAGLVSRSMERSSLIREGSGCSSRLLFANWLGSCCAGLVVEVRLPYCGL